MDDIVFTLEINDDTANKRSNEFLQNGWKLLHVGQKNVGTLDNGQAVYNTVYVVGANEKQYQEYQAKYKADKEAIQGTNTSFKAPV